MDLFIMKHVGKILLLLILPNFVQAYNWNDLWSTHDQQGVKALSEGKPERASQLFIDPKWRAIAYYRAGQYQQAVDILDKIPGEEANYNRGNALAHLDHYEAAIAAYDETLKLNPQHQDAKFNRELLKKLLAEQKNQSKPQAKQNNQSPQANNQNQPPKSSSDSQNNNSDEKKSETKPDQQSTEAKNNSEKEPSSQQMLQQLPDDPGGLLRQKFLRDHMKGVQG